MTLDVHDIPLGARVSFTGTERIADFARAVRAVEDALLEIQERKPSAFHSGGAAGIDTIAATTAAAWYPDAHHSLWLPGGFRHNGEALMMEVPFDSIVTVPGGPMPRNDALVANCDVLLAFPRSEREERRSGTWATIRRARAQGKLILLSPLSQVSVPPPRPLL